MKIKEISKNELELYSYADLTEMILNEGKKSLNTPIVFHKICDLLGYNEAVYTSKIGDYYTSLTIDKRFVLLANAEWDLRDHHPIELILDTDDDDIIDDDHELEHEEEVEVEASVDVIDTLLEEEDLDDDDNDIEDLTIVSEEEIE